MKLLGPDISFGGLICHWLALSTQMWGAYPTIDQLIVQVSAHVTSLGEPRVNGGSWQMQDASCVLSYRLWVGLVWCCAVMFLMWLVACWILYQNTVQDEGTMDQITGSGSRLCILDFFPFRTGLIFRNPPDSGDSIRFCGTLGIKSSRARLICPKSDGIRSESGGKDKMTWYFVPRVTNIQ